MKILPNSGEPRNLLAGTVLGTETRSELLTEPTWQHLHEKYQFQGELGQGGQAVVFLVKERAAPHRRLAVKVYHENSDAAKKLFLNECRVLASNHLPQDLIVGYFQCVDEENLQRYLVLEYIDGRPIGEYVGSGRTMSLAEKIDLWERLCRALHRLHQCHLVFGDLKSENVLVQKDGVIRFIDLAGSKLLKKAYSNSQSSENLATPGVMPEAWKTGESRTALWTDIYVAAAIGFQILTNQQKNDVLPTQWEAKLKDKGIPPRVRRVVLKGLREKDPSKTDDSNLYATAEHLANDLAGWRNAQLCVKAWFRWSAVTLALMLVVGVIGWNNSQKYSTANLKILGELESKVEKLENRTHPAVAKRLQLLETERMTTVDRIAKTRNVLQLSDEVIKAEKMRKYIGAVLLEDESAKRHSTDLWVVGAPMINTRLQEILKKYLDLKKQIEDGEIDSIQTHLAEFMTELTKLYNANQEAHLARDAKREYDQVKAGVPQRLLNDDSFKTIESFGHMAEQKWGAQKWDNGQELKNAKDGFEKSRQRLNEWLLEKLKPEEMEALEKNRQTRIAELNDEREKLLKENTLQTEKVKNLNEQITKLTEERLNDQQKLDTAKTALASEQKRLQETEAKATAGENELQKLRTNIKIQTDDVNNDKQQIAKLNQERDNDQKKLAIAERARDRYREDAARWKTLVQENPGAGIAINKQLIAIEQDLGQLDPKNRDAADETLHKSVAELRALESERMALVKPNGFEPNHPKVKAKDLEISYAANVAENALKKRDECDKLVFSQLQQQIDAVQKLHDDERALGVAELNPELVQLRLRILKFKELQTPHADGALRADLKRPRPTVKELMVIAELPPITPLTSVSSQQLITSRTTGMKLTLIPAGTFTMGSPTSEAGRSGDETQHVVKITKPFYMGVYEVTQGEYKSVMGRNPSYFSTTGGGSVAVRGLTTSNFPVDCVSWDSAQAFCKTLSEQDGVRYRLPTEAEWEYACRAGTTPPFYWGTQNNGTKSNVNGEDPYGTTVKGPNLGRTTTVGSYGANPFGLHDMHGNVWEWCSDRYDANYYGKSPSEDPQGPFSGYHCLVRGGSWDTYTRYTRTAYRNMNAPGNRINYIFFGFRVVSESVRTP